jgi:ribonuclease D
VKHTLIEDQETFDKAIIEIRKSKIIGLDTEFLRTNTYFPLLSLIQISTEDKQFFLFDIHSKNINWSELLSILLDPSIIKIVHSAEQDLEAISYRFNVKIANIMDTQIMADLLDLGRQLGYGFLVEHYFKITLDKDKQFSPWHKRPLTQLQIDYAALDVVYLIDLYNIMLKELKTKKIDTQILFDRSQAIQYKTKYINKSSINKLAKVFCGKYNIVLEDRDLAKDLIELREMLAIKHNKARKYIIEENDISKIIKTKTIDGINLGLYTDVFKKEIIK